MRYTVTAAADLGEAAAPPTQHDRQVCRLAFLAPDLQARLLSGQHGRDLKLRTLLKSEVPLAWADQRRWLAEIGSV